jgi:hypothetical protein
MKVKELFEVIDTRFFCNDIFIVDDANSRSVKAFKYPRDGGTYVKGMLNQFGDRTIVPLGVDFGTDEDGIDYIIIEVK